MGGLALSVDAISSSTLQMAGFCVECMVRNNLSLHIIGHTSSDTYVFLVDKNSWYLHYNISPIILLLGSMTEMPFNPAIFLKPNNNV